MVKIIYFYVFPKMSEQPEQPYSEPRVSLTQLLKELIQLLIENIKRLCSENSLNTANLEKSIKLVLVQFCEKKEIKQIDIFAILNSLRKNSPVSFEMNSTSYSFQFFLGETTLTIGKSSNIITINSKLIIERLEFITSLLTSIQKDFIYLMYIGLYKQFIPIEFKGNFDMSVDCPYDFYMKFYRDHGTTWEERIREILPNCIVLIIKRNGVVSNKQHSYRIKNFHPPESLVMFRYTDYIEDLYEKERLVLRF
jgi:hypothetical protein